MLPIPIGTDRPQRQLPWMNYALIAANIILYSIITDIAEPILFGSNGTAYAAHVSGNLAGILLGLFLLYSRLVQRDHYDLLAMIDRYRRRKQYQALVAGGYNAFNPAQTSP